jgi:hypothetical protein
VIGNNIGSQDAIIAPGASVGTLTTGNLTLNSDAVFAFELNSNNLTADQINVLGTVSLNANSLFSFTDLGAGYLANGQSFILINNDGTDLISGMFGNVSEGTVFSSGPNMFKASYVGGTGNDFSLMSVPEPASFGLLFGVAVSLALRRKSRRISKGL